MNKLLVASAFIGSIFSIHSYAADIGFSGYGSIRGGLLINDDIHPYYFNYTDKVDFKNESLFALQATASLNDVWNATIVMQARGTDEFNVNARWAYLNYDITPNTTLTFGRFANPYFRHSETQDIGYSHDYSRLPKSVYIGNEYDVIEGVRVIHNMPLGDADLTIKSSYGSFSGQVNNVDFTLDDIFQISAEYSHDWLSFFAGVVSAKATYSNQDKLNTLLQTNLTGYTVNGSTVYTPAILGNKAVYDMNSLYIEDNSTLYMSTGITIDHNNWLVNTEYASYNIEDSFREQTNVLYLSVGYRVDDMIISVVHQDLSFDFSYKQANSIDPNVNIFAQGAVDYQLKDGAYDAQGIHLRYDAAENIAYKFEYTRINNDLSFNSADLITLGLDFIF